MQMSSTYIQLSFHTISILSNIDCAKNRGLFEPSFSILKKKGDQKGMLQSVRMCFKPIQFSKLLLEGIARIQFQ